MANSPVAQLRNIEQQARYLTSGLGRTRDPRGMTATQIARSSSYSNQQAQFSAWIRNVNEMGVDGTTVRAMDGLNQLIQLSQSVLDLAIQAEAANATANERIALDQAYQAAVGSYPVISAQVTDILGVQILDNAASTAVVYGSNGANQFQMPAIDNARATIYALAQAIPGADNITAAANATALMGNIQGAIGGYTGNLARWKALDNMMIAKSAELEQAAGRIEDKLQELIEPNIPKTAEQYAVLSASAKVLNGVVSFFAGMRAREAENAASIAAG